MCRGDKNTENWASFLLIFFLTPSLSYTFVLLLLKECALISLRVSSQDCEGLGFSTLQREQ